VPVTYSRPVAPYAAQLEGGKPLALDLLHERFEKLKADYEVVLVEGAGGIAVPLKRNYTYGDLARDWGLSVLIVARAGLGTLNHTFLTVFYARQLNLPIAGLVLNRFTGRDPSEETNPRVVEEMTGLRPVCIKDSKDPVLPLQERRSLLGLIGL